MAVYRYLPIPSDRMGFLWAVTNIPDVAVLEFGPMGTTNFATRHMDEAPIYSTHISDSVLTFGDSRPLRRAVLELEERIHPKLIYLMQSASTSIIGFDMDAFASKMQPEVKARLVPVSLSGLSGDYTVGMSQGLRSLVEQFATAGSQRKKVFHILGASIDNTRIYAEVAELTRLMQGAFGWEPGLILPCKATIGALEASGSAGISLVIRREAVSAAQYLEEVAGVPYLEGIPLGQMGTLNWLHRVGEIIGQQPRQSFIEQELAALCSLPVPNLSGACIVCDGSVAAAWADFFRREWAVPNVRAFAFEKKYPDCGGLVAPYGEAALDDWIHSYRPELLMGNSVVTERKFNYLPVQIPICKPAGIPRTAPADAQGLYGWAGYRVLLGKLTQFVSQ